MSTPYPPDPQQGWSGPQPDQGSHGRPQAGDEPDPQDRSYRPGPGREQPGYGPPPGRYGYPQQPGQGQPGYGPPPGPYGYPQQPGYGPPPGPYGYPQQPDQGRPAYDQAGYHQGQPFGAPAKRRSTVPLVAGIVGAGVVAAAIVVVVLLAVGVLGRTTFDQAALQDGVTGVLTDDYGLEASGVSCPADQEAAAEVTFTCTADVDGESAEVSITVTDDAGTYEVARP